jgi:hypothetical protein
MLSFTSLLVISFYEVFIEGMKYDDTFHTSAHSDLTVINTSYSEVTMTKGMKVVIVLYPLNKYFTQ